MRLDAADLMAQKAAWLHDNGLPCGLEANTAKYLAGEAGFFAADRALADPRRLRLRPGVPRRALLPRGPAAPHRAAAGGDDPQLRRRARPRPAALVLMPEVAPLDPELFRRFVDPRSVVIVGASSNPPGFGGRASVNLTRTGYAGTMHLVNPGRPDDRRPPDRAVGRRDRRGGRGGDRPRRRRQRARRGARLRRARDPRDHRLHRGVRRARRGRPCDRGRDRRIVREAGCRAIGPNCIGVLNVVDNYIAVPTYNVDDDVHARRRHDDQPVGRHGGQPLQPRPGPGDRDPRADHARQRGRHRAGRDGRGARRRRAARR